MPAGNKTIDESGSDGRYDVHGMANNSRNQLGLPMNYFELCHWYERLRISRDLWRVGCIVLALVLAAILIGGVSCSR